ncbi:hypothetical protein Trihar35433_8636 [Trichoderma harzianum]|nr:hypothetical protein Trihar35433_8636 [Trichoderma harzianum]
MWFVNTCLHLGVTALLVQVSSATNAHTDEVCMTRRTTVSPRGAVPTHYHLRTHVDTCKVYVTKTPVKTITPPAKTKTKTITITATTEIDVLQQTDTITSTAFTTTISTSNIPTFTITSTELTTTTSTSTVEGPTVVPTPNGFAPIQSSLPGAVAKKRSVPRGSSHGRVTSFLGSNNRQPMCPVAGTQPHRSWPAEVNCYGVVERYDRKTITITAHKTKTVTACPRTTTVSTTKTCTSTKVVTTADALTTITTTLTETSVITNAPTTSITSTSTVSVIVPTYTATVYAVCSQDNIAGTVNGYGIDTAFSNNNQNFDTSNDPATTKEDCCNSCAANPLCVSSAYEPSFPAGQQCYLVISTQATCSSSDYSLAAVINNPPLPTDGGYFLSNGNCGKFDTTSS